MPSEPLAALALGILSIGFAAAVAVLGFWSLVIPLYTALAVLVIASPERAALLALVAGLALEPDAHDWTRPLAESLYTTPPGIASMLPIVVSPLEALIAGTALTLLLRGGGRGSVPPLPRVAVAVPIAVGLGFAYGAYRGGDVHLGYQEARGLIYGTAAFLVVRKLWGCDLRPVLRSALAGSSLLATIVLLRYLFVIRAGGGGGVVGGFAHEDAIILSSGFILGSALLLAGERGRAWAFLALHNIVVLLAVFATGRRAGTLVLLVGLVMLGWFLLRPRPYLAVALGVSFAVGGSLYLGTYWNQQYGVVAQPARAIRSQIDPDVRDESSDIYREREAFNVRQTLLANPILGVGFGRPFAQFQPLPPLTDFWPLQLYTPHTNILWLWLKLGLIGFSVVLATWTLALRRCLASLRLRHAGRKLAPLPLTLACMLVMYFSNAQVDLALIGTRSAALLAVALACALSLPLTEPGEAHAANQ